jgi:hypothetical protein
MACFDNTIMPDALDLDDVALDPQFSMARGAAATAFTQGLRERA